MGLRKLATLCCMDNTVLMLNIQALVVCFYEKADDVRFSMVSYSKFYTTDGVFLESCLEKTKY